jgi:hypothetical protein
VASRGTTQSVVLYDSSVLTRSRHVNPCHFPSQLRVQRSRIAGQRNIQAYDIERAQLGKWGTRILCVHAHTLL